MKQTIMPCHVIDGRPKERLPRKKKKKDLRTRWKGAVKKINRRFPVKEIQYGILFDGEGKQINLPT